MGSCDKKQMEKLTESTAAAGFSPFLPHDPTKGFTQPARPFSADLPEMNIPRAGWG